VIPLGDRVRRRTLPLATAALLLAELVAFVALIRLPPFAQAAAVARWALVPASLAPLLRGDLAAAGEAVRLLTSLFLHAGWLHLLGNLLFLWVFGRAAEAAMGRPRFLGFFVLCGALAGLVHTLMAPSSAVPTVGASGGVFGLLLAFGWLFPRTRVTLIFPPIPMPAWLFVTLYGLVELASGVFGTWVGVAHFAHLGGMVGAFLVLQLWGRRRSSVGSAGRP
jgi:membrane associated rhomboid family serine protease